MSELFDSLRRKRGRDTPSPSRRRSMNNDEALLASLGYKPIRPNRLAAVSVERIKKLLIRALRITPQSAWAHYNLAVVLDHSREVARARLDALTRR